ncbi:(2Fe-2S)-binding protein [Burkholderia vietnamiensis]
MRSCCLDYRSPSGSYCLRPSLR